MDKLAFGFWGCYFGTTALMLVGSAMAFVRSLHRISLNAALSTLASGFFVLAFLGALPIPDGDTLMRFLAHVTMLVCTVLAYLLFSIVGALVYHQTRQRVQLALAVLAVGGIAVGWLLSPLLSLVLALTLAGGLGLVALGVTLRGVYRGSRMAWMAVVGVFVMLIAMGGLSWIALAQGRVPWQVHAVSALAGTAYLVMMASMLWTRYAYLIELRQIMAHGPSYDPVTRMRSHTETGQMIGHAFRRHRDESAAVPATLGVVVVHVGNLFTLEKLHGMAAVNHALFVCAGRLRNAVPAHVEMGRLAEDGFLLLMRNCRDSGQLIRLAHQLGARLSKSVVLNTSFEAARRESEQTRWEADIGVGVLLVTDPAALASSALATGKAMSRTAMTYASRVAWFDPGSGEAVELPVLEGR